MTSTRQTSNSRLTRTAFWMVADYVLPVGLAPGLAAGAAAKADQQAYRRGAQQARGPATADLQVAAAPGSCRGWRLVPRRLAPRCCRRWSVRPSTRTTTRKSRSTSPQPSEPTAALAETIRATTTSSRPGCRADDVRAAASRRAAAQTPITIQLLEQLDSGITATALPLSPSASRNQAAARATARSNEAGYEVTEAERGFGDAARAFFAGRHRRASAGAEDFGRRSPTIFGSRRRVSSNLANCSMITRAEIAARARATGPHAGPDHARTGVSLARDADQICTRTSAAGRRRCRPRTWSTPGARQGRAGRPSAADRSSISAGAEASAAQRRRPRRRRRSRTPGRRTTRASPATSTARLRPARLGALRRRRARREPRDLRGAGGWSCGAARPRGRHRSSTRSTTPPTTSRPSARR